MYVELQLHKQRQRALEQRAQRERLAAQMRRARRANLRGLARLVALFL